MSRNYGLIAAKGKFDVLKTNMPVLRTSNLQWKTITPIVSRSPLNFLTPKVKFEKGNRQQSLNILI